MVGHYLYHNIFVLGHRTFYMRILLLSSLNKSVQKDICYKKVQNNYCPIISSSKIKSRSQFISRNIYFTSYDIYTYRRHRYL